MTRNRILALAILAILGLAAVAPVGQARDSVRAAERAEQKAVRAAERTAELEARRLARLHAHQEKTSRKNAAREEKKVSEHGATIAANHAVVTIECSRIVVEYKEFPDEPNNVRQRVIFKGEAPGPTWIEPVVEFSFDGTEGRTEIPIAAPLGQSTVIFRSHFASTDIRGNARAHTQLLCGPMPGYSLTTEQAVPGSPYTTQTLPGKVGQSVSYQTLATNSGNMPLTFSGFSSPGCDSPAVGGSTTAVEPHKSVVFNCTHTLDAADLAAGFFANAASVTGTPGPGGGEPITHVSPGVLVSPIGLGAEPGNGAGGKGEVSTAAAPPASSAPNKAVLGFSSARIPSLLGPAKCVRSYFTVSVKSAGVASVIFYLDGHRLARRTVHSAKHGLISLRINGTKLKSGVHHLRATITMAPGSPTSKSVVASRVRILHRCKRAPAKH